MYFYEIPMNDEKMFKYPLELVKQSKGKNIWASRTPIEELKPIENDTTKDYLENKINNLKDKKLKEIL
uniref:hypothetical protein n=1 Tax=Campylobacter sputorum TaxID=206 RepID=UPI00053BE516